MSLFERPLQPLAPSRRKALRRRDAQRRRRATLPAAVNAIILFGLALHCACVTSTTFTPEPPTVPALRLPMNNAYLGSLHSSDLRPRFVWEPSTAYSSGDIRYELQFSTDFMFGSEVTSISTFETTYQPPTALPVSREAPVGARYFWRVRACLLNSCSLYIRSWYANVGRVVKDYNGDGYSDVAAGATGIDTFGTDRGAIAVDYGGTGNTLDGVPDSFIKPTQYPHEPMGSVLSGAGDVNGDGFADLIVGIPEGVSSVDGVALVYFGGKEGLRDESRSGLQGQEPIDKFAGDVGKLSDMNGDGFDDVFVVSADTNGGGARKIEIYFGGRGVMLNAKADATLMLDGGYSVALGGDVNGDGFSDLIISNRSDGTEGSGAGAARIYSVSAGEEISLSETAALYGSGVGDNFGTGVSSGDFNGDGFADLAIGNRRPPDASDDQPGRVEVFLSSRGTFSRTGVSTLSGRSDNDLFGAVLAEPVDMNGDGCSDLLVGAGYDSRGVGAVFLFSGCKSAGFEMPADAVFTGPSGVFFGEILVSSGDVNGDGFGDFSASTPEFQEVRGRVDTFLGGSVVDENADVIMISPAVGDTLKELAFLHLKGLRPMGCGSDMDPADKKQI